MIGPTGTVRVLVATKPVDFRKGADGLAALVRDTMGADPFSGAVYVFRAKRTDRVKLVFWDGRRPTSRLSFMIPLQSRLRSAPPEHDDWAQRILATVCGRGI